MPLDEPRDTSDMLTGDGSSERISVLKVLE
jgi:hypothetical protein